MNTSKAPQTNLHPGLIKYLSENNILTSWIDVKKSQIDRKKRYQVLVLQKPEEIISELEKIQWEFTPDTSILLVFDSTTGETKQQRLNFTIEDPNPGPFAKDKKFDFGSFCAMVVNDEQGLIMLSINGTEGFTSGGNHCTDIVLLTTQGQFVKLWQIGVAGGNKYEYIRKIRQVREGYWLLEIEETFKFKSALMLSRHKIGYDSYYVTISSENDLKPNTSFDETSVEKIQTWFSNSEGIANFCIVTSYHACKIFSFEKHGASVEYCKVVSTNYFEGYIREIKVVHEENKITVDFVDTLPDRTFASLTYIQK